MSSDLQILKDTLNNLTAMRNSKLAPDLDGWLKETISKLNKYIENASLNKQPDKSDPSRVVRCSLLQGILPYLTRWIPPGDMEMETVRKYRLRALQLEEEILAILRAGTTHPEPKTDRLKRFYAEQGNSLSK